MLFLGVLLAGETCWHVVFSSLEIFVYDFMCAFTMLFRVGFLEVFLFRV